MHPTFTFSKVFSKVRVSATLLAFFLPFVSWAHAGLYGRVYNTDNSQPIAGAVVRLMPSKAMAYTDEHGQYAFKGLAGGSYTVQATHLGFTTQSVDIVLEDNARLELPIGLAEKRLSMDEVLITPTKELGSTTISGLDLKLRPVDNTQDLLRLVPGLFIAQHAGGGKAEQIFLRGFDVDHGTDVAVSVDGMPVNMVSHAHGQGYADLHFVIPELVDKMNFSKGPYDAKTGDFNTAGAVRFQTRSFLPKSFVKLEGGQYGYLRGVTGINLLGNGDSSKSKQSAYIAAEFLNSDGFFEHSQNFQRINVLGKYTAELSAGTYLSASLSHFTSRWDASGQIPDRAVASGLIGFYGSIDPTEGGNTSRDNVNIQLSKTLDNGAVIRNQLYYSAYTFNLYSNFTFFAEDSVRGDQINQYEKRNLYGYNGSYSITHQLGNVSLATTAGVQLRNDDIEPVGLAHTRRRVFLEDIKKGSTYQTNAAAYVEETAYITPRLTASLGLRYDVFRFRYNSALTDTPGVALVKGIASPKLNIFYNLTERAQIYVSAGTGFHSNDARVATAARTSNTLPRATGADLGANVKLGRLFINAALWELELENEFVYSGDAGTVEVSGYTRRIGVDVSARWQLAPWLFADLDVNACRPHYTSGPETERNVPLAPTLTSIGGLSFNTKTGFSGSIRYRRLGSRPAIEDNSIRASGYTIADVLVNYARGSYLFTASAENITNVRWKEAQFATTSRLQGEPAPVTEIHFTPGTPLFIKGSVTYSF